MKKIALLMDGWKRFFTYAWPAGVLQRIKETNEDISLYIFNSSGDWSRDKDYNIGEYNIYHLPNLNEYDGIIVDLNNIRYPEVRDYVIESAKKTGPVRGARLQEVLVRYGTGGQLREWGARVFAEGLSARTGNLLHGCGFLL